MNFLIDELEKELGLENHPVALGAARPQYGKMSVKAFRNHIFRNCELRQQKRSFLPTIF